MCTGAVVVAIIDFQWIKNFSESESIKLTLAAMLNFHMEKSNKMLRTTQIVLLSSLVSFWQRRLKCENLMDNRRWQMNSRWWKYQLTWTFGSGDKIPAHMDVWFRWQNTSSHGRLVQVTKDPHGCQGQLYTFLNFVSFNMHKP